MCGDFKPVEVYFDDFKVTQIKSPVIQSEDFFPGGLSFNQYQRENSVLNKYQYNGKELQTDLSLNWSDYGARMYMSDVGRWLSEDPKAELQEMSSPYVYSLNNPINFVDKNGELPIYINGRVSSSSERANEKYWNVELLRTIASSGIANPGGEIHYVDGDVGMAYSGKTRKFEVNAGSGEWAGRREEAGAIIGKKEFEEIMARLARDPKTGKITEKIQIYTHSRGAAFGAGYTTALLKAIQEHSSEFADASNVIDFVYNMAPHQSNSITAPEGVDSYSHEHSGDAWSGNDMKGLKGAFTSNEKVPGAVGSHKNASFVKDAAAFLAAFKAEGKDSKKLVKSVVSRLQGMGIQVTVRD